VFSDPGASSGAPRTLALSVVVAVITLFFLAPQPVHSQSLTDLETRLEQRVQDWLAAGQWMRPDGYIYSIDVGQLLIYAALRRNERLYTTLRDFVSEKLIRDDPSDPYTQGFVIWRYRDDTAPDASGATEALRIAQGLWLGSRAFGQVQDNSRALLIFRGYARHAYVDQGVWLIRNYFNLGTRAFATNSFLVNFDVDLLSQVGETGADDELEEVAAKSYDLVSRAVTPVGLLDEIIQPEIITLLPDLNLSVFSPNGVVHLANTCTVAERSVLRDREIGARVLRFASDRAADLKTYYRRDTGEPVSDRRPGPATYACLVRLGVKLGDGSVELFLSRMAQQLMEFLDQPYELRLYNAGEFLLALRYAIDGPSIGRT
jgi:hypothetical protein